MAKKAEMKDSKKGKWGNYLTIGARWLLGLVYFAGGISYFFMSEMPLDSLPPKAAAYMTALMATGFFLPFLKGVETIAGAMLFFKRWTPLSLLILAPITIQILLYGIFLDHNAVIVGIVMSALSIVIMWRNWDKYAQLFRA